MCLGHDLRSRRPSWTDTEGIVKDFGTGPEDTELTASLSIDITPALDLALIRDHSRKIGKLLSIVDDIVPRKSRCHKKMP